MTASFRPNAKIARGIVSSDFPDSGIGSRLATTATALADAKFAASRSPNGKQCVVSSENSRHNSSADLSIVMPAKVASVQPRLRRRALRG